LSQATRAGRLERVMPAGAGTAGMTASAALQVVRRAAVTAVAVSTTDSTPAGSVCEMLITQCWVDRLVRTGRDSTRNGPSDSAAAKFTVNDTGSPRRPGCCITDCRACAAVMPPNGPTMLAYAGWVLALPVPGGLAAMLVRRHGERGPALWLGQRDGQRIPRSCS
jgi:hypothetical protein